MSTTRTYLDYNATAPVHDAVREAVARALARTGNPSSVHREGRAARGVIETAREQVARLVDASAEDVVFTSGGTEANALAIHSAVASGLAARLVVSAIEHPSVLEAAQASGVPCSVVPVDGDGVVDLVALDGTLGSDPAPALVCIMHANNETGAVQPVADAAAIAHAHGALFHLDAVQSAGRIPLSLAALGADSLALSAHKIGGPQGVGALVARSGLAIRPLLCGGGQERGRRSGTENVAGIAGFGIAAGIAASSAPAMASIEAMRDRLEAEVRAVTDDLIVISADAPRLSNTSCLALPGSSAETLVIALDLAGIAVSSGSACSSGKVGESHVLVAMGFDKNHMDGAVRVSLGWATTEEEIDRFVAAWRNITSGRSTQKEIAA